jgi:hypothetical protein
MKKVIVAAVGLSLFATQPANAGSVPDSYETWDECLAVSETSKNASGWVGTCVMNSEGRWYISYTKQVRAKRR